MKMNHGQSQVLDLERSCYRYWLEPDWMVSISCGLISELYIASQVNMSSQDRRLIYCIAMTSQTYPKRSSLFASRKDDNAVRSRSPWRRASWRTWQLDIERVFFWIKTSEVTEDLNSDSSSSGPITRLHRQAMPHLPKHNYGVFWIFFCFCFSELQIQVKFMCPSLLYLPIQPGYTQQDAILDWSFLSASQRPCGT